MRRFLISLVFFQFLSHVTNQGYNQKTCEPGSHLCSDKSKCVLDKDLCDYNKDCDDLSDERFSMCRKILEKKNTCTYGQVWSAPYSTCQSISEVCKVNSVYYREDFLNMCNEIKEGLKPFEEFDTFRNEETKLEDIFSHLASAFNETTLVKDFTGCPPLYVKLEKKCLALFSIAKVTWAEARQFCESISGTLGIINDLQDYDALLRYLQNNDLTTNFWIGGRFKARPPGSISSWTWLNDENIAMGSPYWSLNHTPNCTKRGTSDVCYDYTITPLENKDGFCLAMDYALFYYFSDQNCHEKRSPLCLLN